MVGGREESGGSGSRIKAGLLSVLRRNSGRKKNSGMSSFTSVADSEEESHQVVAISLKVRSAMSKLLPWKARNIPVKGGSLTRKWRTMPLLE